MLWAVQNSFIDDVPVERIKDFQAKLDGFPDHLAKPTCWTKIAQREGARATAADRRVEGGGRPSSRQTWNVIATMPSTRDIRRRIKSVKNTAQITKAMQMVAASKMRKAQQAALAGRPVCAC